MNRSSFIFTTIIVVLVGIMFFNTNFAAESTGEYFSYRQEALAKAAEKGDVATINSLLIKGVKVDFQGREGMTVLIWSFLKQNKKGYAFLLEKGADPNLLLSDGNSAVSCAAMANDPWYLKETLKHGGDPNLFNPERGFTPIFASIEHLRAEQVRLLIASGADLNAVDRNGDTPIKTAVVLNQYEIVYDLLKAGANPSIRNKWGKSALDLMKEDRTDPVHPSHLWREKVLAILRSKGITVGGDQIDGGK